MGQAVVAFDREISRDILKNCGLIAEFMNVEDLFHKISELLENEKKVIDLGRKARKRAQLYYSWDAVADRIEKQYKIVLQEVLWKKK
jgi:glycosyltransferase involved in cell wall biosynthesis